jgi:hypothetical protein
LRYFKDNNFDHTSPQSVGYIPFQTAKRETQNSSPKERETKKGKKAPFTP